MISSIQDIACIVRHAGGRALLVGGCVRDRHLTTGPFQPVDFDMEVFGLTPAQLRLHLSLSPPGPGPYDVDEVGKSFGVFKLANYPVDISFPRRDSKTGPHHRDFDVGIDPNMSLDDALRRRDFTMNAMASDPLTQELFDPYNGRADLDRGILRHVDSTTFGDDPLRVLRAAQFAARFDLMVHPDTAEICRSLSDTAHQLSNERVWGELMKLLAAPTPSRGLQFLLSVGWLRRLFPEIHALVGVPQNPKWHPEGDVFTHTCHCLDAMQPTDTDTDNLIVALGVLLHDVGKATHTVKAADTRHWSSVGHEAAGVPIATQFLSRLTNQQSLIDEVAPLIEHHLRPLQLVRSDPRGKVSRSAVRRLARDVNIDRLMRVVHADINGRPGVSPSVRTRQALLDLHSLAIELQVDRSAPAPIMLGRHLIELGLEPGPKFGPILATLYEMQLGGLFYTPEDGKLRVADVEGEAPA